MNNVEIQHETPPCDRNRLMKVMLELDDVLVPKLSTRVDMKCYVTKLGKYADIFYVCVDGEIVGNCAIYLNQNEGYISSIALKSKYQKQGLGQLLWKETLKVAEKKGLQSISLEVFKDNTEAVHFYHTLGFMLREDRDTSMLLTYTIKQ